MSEDIDIFVRNSPEIERIAEEIGSFLGHRMIKRADVEWKLYEANAAGFHVSIFEAEDSFENDFGIEFEKYPIVVGMNALRFMISSEHFDEWFELFPLILAEVLHRRLECECLVVRNFCRIVGAFPDPELVEQHNG